MEQMLTVQLPKKDVQAFLRVIEDIRFIEEAEKGDEEISRGKYITLEQLKKKYSYS